MVQTNHIDPAPPGGGEAWIESDFGGSTRLEHPDLHAGRAKITGVLIDQRPGVPVAGNGDSRPDHLRGPSRVRGPHREAIPDGDDRHVRLVDLPDQLHVTEESGVSAVVDRPITHADDQTRRHPRVPPLVTGGVVGEGERDPAERQVDTAPGIGWFEILHPFLTQEIGQFESGDHRRPGPFRDRDRVPDMVLVTMGEGDVGRIQRIRGDSRGFGLGIPRDEGIDEHGVRAVGHGEGGVAEESNAYGHDGSPRRGCE